MARCNYHTRREVPGIHAAQDAWSAPHAEWRALPELDPCAYHVATSPALERPHGGQREPLGDTNERGAHGRVTQQTYNSTDCRISEHDIVSIVQVISTSASTVCTVRFTISPVVSSWYLLLMATTWACRLGRATPRFEIRGQGVKIPFGPRLSRPVMGIK